MRYSTETTPLEKIQCDCLVIGVYQNLQLTPSALAFDQTHKGFFTAIIQRGDFSGKNGDTLLLNSLPDCACRWIMLVGLGEQEQLSGKNYIKALTAAAINLKKSFLKSVAVSLSECPAKDVDTAWKVRQIVETLNDAAYQYTHTKTDKETESKLEHIIITGTDTDKADIAKGLIQGKAIAGGVNLTKWLADLPGNICTPSFLAEQAVILGEKHDQLDLQILEESDMEQLGMGSLLSVTRGSRQPAKLIVINYQGGEKNSKPIVLVGKGLTFDAGGISLKAGLGMDEMKYDMCGGAAVLGTLQAAIEMDLPLNIIGLIPASENLPDGNANKPGDIWTSMSGKTIEILNTDAEGRLILCDTLTYAERFNPDVVIDMATLTGACLVALGRIPSGLLGNDDDLCNDLIKASETANDSLWRLPLWEEYQELLKSNFADMANIGGKDAGTITAACFLARFAENFRWAHLDIAGTAWRTGLTKGATGRPVPLLTQYLIDRSHAVDA